ncbi:hypothetical protein LS41612_08845 [Lysinibacillus sphaericus]|uniref:Uncharacterized protein n=1 Tax=Lysinibacillus sphaericus TaxID=1421 RepID=A0A2S0JYY0_LYSSH|nr:hypothetical protein LS41612_08845 [Lysinibacillus sphaericus]
MDSLYAIQCTSWRIEKCSEGRATYFVWDGNTILYEYFTQDNYDILENFVEKSPQKVADIADNLVTWVFNDGFVVPSLSLIQMIW